MQILPYDSNNLCKAAIPITDEISALSNCLNWATDHILKESINDQYSFSGRIIFFF